MRNWIYGCVVAVQVVLSGWAAEPVLVRVTADRVNLRAIPSLQAETVGQVNYDDVLEALQLGTNWVEIVPPDGIDFWVHRDFIVNGQVNARELNVRAGPGINFKVVGQLERNDRVDVRGEFSEWIKIGAPPGASVWIAREFVEEARPGNREGIGLSDPHHQYQYAPAQPMQPLESEPALSPKPQDSAGQVVGIQQRPRPKLKRTVPLPPDWELIPLEGQGKTVEVAGTLRKIGFMIRRPTRFRLIQDGNGRSDMICYVRGNEDQLKEFVGRSMILTGREYWVQGYRYPIVVIERMRLTR